MEAAGGSGETAQVAAAHQSPTLRPDIIVVSESSRQVMTLELTVNGTIERKLVKYEGLVGECRQ